MQVYSEHPLPHGAALWRSVDSAAGVIAADGCVDLILRDERVLVAGPSTRWIATLADDEHGSLGLRLPPGTAGPLLQAPLGDLADRLLPLEDVVSVSRARHLRQQLIGTAAAADAVVGLTAAVVPALDDDAWVARVRGGARDGVAAHRIAADVDQSERTLRRRMRSTFGYGYATLVRIERAARAQGLLRRGSSPAEAAAIAGYADQPHLSREFRRVVGMSPAQFSASVA